MGSVKNKWDKIYSQSGSADCQVSEVLKENAFLLPGTGKALDIACGLGGNALFLAEYGLEAEAWDISSVAIESLRSAANYRNLNVDAQVTEINRKSFSGRKFNVIVISRFLDRSISDGIMKGLESGGLLFYQTFSKEKVCRQGPENPQYLLSENELLDIFAPLRVVFYRENGRIGDIYTGLRNEMQFVGQKP